MRAIDQQASASLVKFAFVFLQWWHAQWRPVRTKPPGAPLRGVGALIRDKYSKTKAKNLRLGKVLTAYSKCYTMQFGQFWVLVSDLRCVSQPVKVFREGWFLAKLSKEEIAARRKRMQSEALSSVAKTEQLNIRIDEQSIQRLYKLAGRENKPVGTMVREWILDKLRTEEQPGGRDPMQKLTELVSVLNAKIDRLDYALLAEQSPAAVPLVSEKVRVRFKGQKKRSKK